MSIMFSFFLVEKKKNEVLIDFWDSHNEKVKEKKKKRKKKKKNEAEQQIFLP